jgi:hypothetical protein
MEERDSMPISDEKCVQNVVSNLNGRESFGAESVPDKTVKIILI